MAKQGFREQVTVDLLIDRVVPPFHPPRKDQAVALLVVAVLLVPMLLFIAWAVGDWAWLFCPALAGGFIYGSVIALNRAKRRQEEYISLHAEARAVAHRLLSGREDDRGARMRMQSYADDLLKLQDKSRAGTTWVFVWWES